MSESAREDGIGRRPRRRGVHRVARAVLRTVLGLGAGFYLCCVLRLIELRWLDPSWTTVQIQRRLEAWGRGEKLPGRWNVVPLAAISDHLEHAVIAAEDGRFGEHWGIDWKELREAVEGEASGPRRRRRGASTITQQLAKNLFLTTHRSYVRKAVEFTLAPVAELILPKRRILELYLNVVEWGPGVYGAEAAARYHYGVTAAGLTRDQAARLAACLPAPLRRRPARMSGYGGIILERMASQGW